MPESGALDAPPKPDPNQPRASVQREYFNDGVQLKLERHVLVIPGGGIVPNGREAAWYSDGVQEYERFFENDQPAGVWKAWYRTGAPRSEVQVGSTGTGTTTWWYENGVISSKGQTVGGLKQGPWVHRYENGQRSAEGEYSRGKRQGAWQLWEESGKPKASGKYENGVRVGRWELWTESGESVSRGSDDPPN